MLITSPGVGFPSMLLSLYKTNLSPERGFFGAKITNEAITQNYSGQKWNSQPKLGVEWTRPERFSALKIGSCLATSHVPAVGRVRVAFSVQESSPESNCAVFAEVYIAASKVRKVYTVRWWI